MKAAARLLLRLPKFSHISAVMTGQLHWYPAARRTQFKLLLYYYPCFALSATTNSLIVNHFCNMNVVDERIKLQLNYLW
jgi:hypothetical protein